MADEAVREVQTWLNSTYGTLDGWVHVDEDGYTGGGTVAGLIRGLQHELNTSMDGIFGVGTMNLFNSMFPNGLSIQTQNQNANINYIINGGFFCRGIDPGSFSGVFTEGTKTAVQTLQEQIGLSSQNGIVNAKILRAILTTDAFTLVTVGDNNIRTIQRSLNNKYGNVYETYIPTNGLYERKTNEGLIKAVQYKVGATIDGLWGEDTMSKLPTLQRGSSNTDMVYLLQYSLYVNGYNPNGFDGQFGGGAESAVKQCQSDYILIVDGICGRQTWSALLVSCGDITRSTTACDASVVMTQDRINLLKNNGYMIIGRYIIGTTKKMTNDEFDLLTDNGMGVFPIYQEYGRDINNFSYEQGKQQALKATEEAKRLGFPIGTVIYFAADLDAYDVQITSNIIPYFKGIYENIDSAYRIGVYGSRNTCRRVKEAGYSVSSFVSDSSYLFSGNIGYRIPEDWNYDQIVELKKENTVFDFDIDKVVYKLRILPTYEVDENMRANAIFYTQMRVIYEKFKETVIGEKTIQEYNHYVLQYLRYKTYNSASWIATAGLVDETLMQLIESYCNINPATMQMNIKECQRNMEIAHLAATTDAHVYSDMNSKPPFGPGIPIKNLAGWAGDLLQLAGNLQNKYNNGRNYSVEEIIDLIGCDSDARAIELGFSSARNAGFDIVDLYQDIDAVNYAEELRYYPIYNVFIDYFAPNNYNKRATKFYQKLFGNDTNRYQNLYNLAYRYTNQEEPAGQPFYADFNKDLWNSKLAQAFATKIVSMIENEERV